MRMETQNMKAGWASDGKAPKPFEERRRANTSVSRRKAAGGKLNKKHRFVGSFGSDRHDR